MKKVMWFLKELHAAFRRLRERDPFTYWCTMVALVANTASLVLHAFR